MSSLQSTNSAAPPETESGDHEGGNHAGSEHDGGNHEGGEHEEGDHPRGNEARGNRTNDTVDKIRDLIFGEQMAGYEQRFNALEARLVGEVDSLRQTVEEKLAELKVLSEKRSDEIEGLAVSRKKLGDSLHKLADSIRD